MKIEKLKMPAHPKHVASIQGYVQQVHSLLVENNHQLNNMIDEVNKLLDVVSKATTKEEKKVTKKKKEVKDVKESGSSEE